MRRSVKVGLGLVLAGWEPGFYAKRRRPRTLPRRSRWSAARIVDKALAVSQIVPSREIR
jgi:hypothetical protein